MYGEYKGFDKVLFDRNDKKARLAAKLLLMSSDRFGATFNGVVDNEDTYGPDLKITKDGVAVGYLEVEIKSVWDSYDFPWPSVQFPERKAKFVVGSKYPIYFLMFNKCLTRALAVTGQTLIDSPVKEVKTVYTNNENFFQVPVGFAKFYDTETAPIKQPKGNE